MKSFPSFLIILVMMAFLFTAATAADTLPKAVLLTFDDGPDPRCTPDILDILAEHKIKGIFFVTGKACRRHPELLQRIADEGHVLANHTFSHKVIKGMDEEQIINEITSTQKIIYKLTNQSAKYFRPPTGAYGKREALILNELGQEVLMWDLGLEKRNIKTAGGQVDNLISRIGIRRELIILMHDGAPFNRHNRNTTVKALPGLIKKLQKQGFSFVDPSSAEGKEFIEEYIKRNPKINVY
ncbi:peptidoglycan/xylan/chitin deacetylase (PgdA/CDA1 family) [Desulfohalotomaculum tongense]|uniref:polysaccharide deacetylase family protein n=1 Tax=Desulforadius tongensis TaxID=1216062 RepID=UPI00195E0C07|nr:polysaccharide deacetylase family protein [Desulforadius tongensis]MBM7854805.1 peptidoglycan/xylan/chitin deacetylase (PgdA/CDA1 family) [Desulforadius tongensis]